MSGRLIILPKKSYCPWNPSNIERVLRDERKHSHKQNEEKAQQVKTASEARLTALRNESRTSSDHQVEGERSGPTAKHVNFFATEEEEHLRCSQTGTNSLKKKVGIMPSYLGASVKNQKKPFYLQPGSHEVTDQGSRDLSKEDRLKKRLDPMKHFVSSRNEKSNPTSSNSAHAMSRNLPPEREQRKHKDKQSRGHRLQHHQVLSKLDVSPERVDASSCDDSDSIENRRKRKRSEKESRRERSRERRHKSRRVRESGDSTEELRRRRVQREDTARERQSKILEGASRAGHGQYQDQFYPRLSRK